MTPAARSAGVVIVAAGRGERFGDAGKVLAVAGGRPLLAWSVEAALAAISVRQVVVVAGGHTVAPIAAMILERFNERPVTVCTGGPRRQDSVRCGLAHLDPDIDIAAVHDAARPLVTAALFDAVIAATGDGGAIAVGPVTDTIKRVEGGTVVETIDRVSLRAAQTPQAAPRALLEAAFSEADARGVDVTDEASLLEWLGHPVTVVDHGELNFKVTVPQDLALVAALLAARASHVPA